MNTREQAEQHLRDWAANNARRDKVVLAALAAGIEKKRVHELTGIARTTINRIEGNAMQNTAAAIAAEFDVPAEDVLALADQLVGIDGSEAVVAHEDRYSVTFTDAAAETIRQQLRDDAEAASRNA